MTATLATVEASEITTGAQLFRCIPYNCTLLARACVERQAKAELGLEAITLLKCKGCELGAVVRQHATDVTFTERELLRGARGSGHHRSGALGKKMRGARMNPDPDAPQEPKLAPRRALPIVGLAFEPTPVPPPPWKPWANRVLDVFDAEPRPYAVACARCRTEFATSKALGAHHVHCKTTNEEGMPNTLDLEGKELAGVKVLRILPKEKGQNGALWRVRFRCGHEDSVLGFLLTSAEKNGAERKCKVCKAAKRGAPQVSKPSPKPDAHRAKAPKSAPRKGTQELALPAPARALSGPVESKSYEFPLRRDFGASVTLPVDLTMHDVERLTRWLETLVFDDAVAAE